MGVYIVLAEEVNRIKVGVTQGRISSRMNILRNGSPCELRLLLHIATASYELEHSLHMEFGPYHSHREWFNYTEPVRSRVQKLIEEHGHKDNDLSLEETIAHLSKRAQQFIKFCCEHTRSEDSLTFGISPRDQPMIDELIVGHLLLPFDRHIAGVEEYGKVWKTTQRFNDILVKHHKKRRKQYHISLMMQDESETR